ncbi:MAG: NAD-dependent deacetylase [Actinomycetota bacterium]|nr:NAD-dependent deacetylase [Actinomycetota bacterium]
MADHKFKSIAGIINDSNKITILTGAGISTESGIPDFRSKKTGLWNRFDSSLLSREFLYKNPEKFYELAIQLLSILKNGQKIKPNKAHYILAEMENNGIISSLITQNIDNLHKLAGSKNIYEVHGNMKKAYCVFCKNEYSFLTLYKKVLRKQIPPLCPECGSILRTSVILFGDELNEQFYKAREEAMTSDLMMVIGSSLEVGPVNTLPMLAKKFIIINRDRTCFDSQAFLVINKNAADALSEIYKFIKER